MQAAGDAVSDKIDESKHDVCHTPPRHCWPDIVLTFISTDQGRRLQKQAVILEKQSANTKKGGLASGRMVVSID